MDRWLRTYQEVREQSEHICAPLAKEDYVVQPIVDVSPPKWHLGHTTWFYETFLLSKRKDYRIFDPQYNYVFNSYYESVGARVIRTDRGNLSRPTVDDVYAYRRYVDEHVAQWISAGGHGEELDEIMAWGINHEQQHQELLLTDIKYILGHNPLFPPYQPVYKLPATTVYNAAYQCIPEGLYQIGYEGDGFCFDNERDIHRIWLDSYEIATQPVTNGEFLAFIRDGGYTDFRHWHAEGWEWVCKEQVRAPLYWYEIDGEWMYYTLAGMRKAGYRRTGVPYKLLRGLRVCRMEGMPASDRSRVGGCCASDRMGTALGMDQQRIPALSAFSESRGSPWRVQRQIYGQPKGVARRVRCDSHGAQQSNVPKFLSPVCPLAIYRDPACKK